MPETCSCCGQEIANPVWDRDAQRQAEIHLRDVLLAFLGPAWSVTADNALILRDEDTKLEVVVHALIRTGATLQQFDGSGAEK